MATLVKLQRNAEMCLRMAERSRDPNLKIAWAQLTEAWLSLVATDKRRGRHKVNWRASHRRTDRGDRSVHLKAA